MASETQLSALLAPVLADLGLDLEEIRLTKAGSRRLLAIAIDRDGGLDLDAITDASHAISTALDESSIMGETPYVLEVSSRGVDKPLTLPRHWRRNIGRLVHVVGADFDLVGRIVSTSDDSALIDTGHKEVPIAFACVSKALVQVEFGDS